MINQNVLKEFMFEKDRCNLENYKAVVITNADTWERLVEYFVYEMDGDWMINTTYRYLLLPKTNGSIRFLNVKGVTFKDIQMFSRASRNSTVIIDADPDNGYRGGMDGIAYLLSRMGSVATCHTRLVVI